MLGIHPKKSVPPLISIRPRYYEKIYINFNSLSITIEHGPGKQLAGTDQITRAMESIHQGATQTQNGMPQVDQAAQYLNDLARQLSSIAQTYKVG